MQNHPSKVCPLLHEEEEEEEEGVYVLSLGWMDGWIELSRRKGSNVKLT